MGSKITLEREIMSIDKFIDSLIGPRNAGLGRMHTANAILVGPVMAYRVMLVGWLSSDGVVDSYAYVGWN